MKVVKFDPTGRHTGERRSSDVRLEVLSYCLRC